MDPETETGVVRNCWPEKGGYVLGQRDKNSVQAGSRREWENSWWREQLSLGPDEEIVTR